MVQQAFEKGVLLDEALVTLPCLQMIWQLPCSVLECEDYLVVLLMGMKY